MKEICLVTKDGLTRQAENSSEFKHESAEWFIHHDDYNRLAIEHDALLAKLAECVAALEFYAAGPESFKDEMKDDYRYGGKLAREVLARVKK